MATKRHEKTRKMNRSIRPSSCAFLCLFVAIPPVGADEAPGPVVVELRPQAMARGRTVTLGDVADLRGGNDLLRERIARLDLTELPVAGASVTIKRTQVEYRLRLADVPSALFRLTGASEVTVTSARQAFSGEQIASAARDALLRRLPWAAEDVSIRVVQPITVPPSVTPDDGDVTVTAEPHTPGAVTGRVRMDVIVAVRGERKLSLPVYLEVRPLQTVAICRQRIERGAPLSEANVAVERRPAESGQAAAAPADAV